MALHLRPQHESSRAIPIALEVALATLGGGAMVAAWRWNARTAALLARLRRQEPAGRAVFDRAELEGLPAPVVRYFRAALQDGQRIVRHARVTHAGHVLVRPRAEAWHPFTSTEWMTGSGFVWDARIRLAPGFSIRVCDSLVDGIGSMRASVLGIWPLTHMQGASDRTDGALLRYLAEAVWIPTALLPGQGVVWTALDDASARATLTCGPSSASLDFHFGDDGLVRSVFSEARPREVGGRSVPTPWQGRFTEYEARMGMTIPLCAEVEWLLPDGAELYWRGRITGVQFELEGASRDAQPTSVSNAITAMPQEINAV